MSSTAYDSPEDAIRAYAPAKSQKLVVPANADLPDGVCKSLEVIAVGNVVTLAEGDSVAFTRTAIPVGTLIRVRVKQVLTGTPATVLALY
jgi:hypothetical protein